ncbi:hypothetical protein BDR06DRAFT_1005849 [Suillus hirtellus]|nr:hypothetical protein BDR06DRAFT_1005849 [Suillus hirtellus]
MPEAANDTLNITLATLQSLIKHCIHLKQGDQEALKLSDEIARRMAKDLKLYGGSATSFSPQLLSCAAVVRQYSKGGAFETLPDWNSVVDDDPHIKTHPRFHKTLDYRPLAAVGTLPILESQATRSSSIVRPFTVPTAVGPVTKQAPAVEVDSTPLSPGPTSLELEPLTPLAPSVTSAAPSTTWHKLFVPGNISKKVKIIPHPRNDKKRKAEEDDTDSADAPRSPTRSHKPNLKKIKKLLSHDRQNKLHKTRSGTTKAGLLTESSWSVVSQHILDPEAQDAMDTDSDNSFWDADTRPNDWGLDSMIATAVEHSIRYHPRKCDKCKKSGKPCIVLPDKKVGCIRLVCANCNRTKVTGAIDGMGVWDRLQAQAKATAVTQAADRPRRSRSRCLVT